MTTIFPSQLSQLPKLDPLGGVAIRFRVRADLAGRRFEDFHVDVGVESEPAIVPDVLTGPDMLSFAGISPIAVQVISIEQHIAEKVSAYVRIYQGQRRSSRVKDLVDLVLIQRLTQVNAEKLRHALEVTFGSQADSRIPTSLPPPPDYWEQPYKQMAAEVRIDQRLSDGYRIAAAFLDPVLSGSVNGSAIWTTRSGSWLDEVASV